MEITIYVKNKTESKEKKNGFHRSLHEHVYVLHGQM